MHMTESEERLWEAIADLVYDNNSPDRIRDMTERAISRAIEDREEALIRQGEQK